MIRVGFFYQTHLQNGKKYSLGNLAHKNINIPKNPQGIQQWQKQTWKKTQNIPHSPKKGVLCLAILWINSLTRSSQSSGDFTPFISNFQMWDHSFPLTFSQRFWNSKNVGHPTSGSGGKKKFKRYLKTKVNTQTNTDKHMDKSTYRKHRPRGPMLWKGKIRLTNVWPQNTFI